MGTRSAFQLATILVAASLVAACGPKPLMTRPSAESPNKYAIFLDGTANDFVSDTSIAKLRHRVVSQPNDHIGTFYVEGVGAGDKVAGMVTGWGLGHRVRQAYAYLLQNYAERDDIYLFGFSRGAYSTRILASVIHYGGLPSEPLRDRHRAEAIAAAVFDAYKGEKEHERRQSEVRATLEKLGVQDSFRSRRIRFMGVWDTVSALGTRDHTEDDATVPSALYADQLCNVDKAMHALSLDDNRALEFTPILLTREYLVANCFTDDAGRRRTPSTAEAAEMLDTVVDEMWFPGAHSDVGGGYDQGRLSGLALNWMLPELRKRGLLASEAFFPEHPLDCVHDAQSFLGGKIYKRRPRSIEAYMQGSVYNGGRFKIYPSVITRLAALPHRELAGDDQQSGHWDQGSSVGLGSSIAQACFERTPDGRYLFRHPSPPQCRLDSKMRSPDPQAPWLGPLADSRIRCEAFKDE